MKVVQILLFGGKKGRELLPPKAIDDLDTFLRFKNSTLAKNPILASCENFWPETLKIKAQICTLYKAVDKLNSHFWPALLDPGEHLLKTPMAYAIGSVEQMQAILNLTFQAWGENPGAMDLVKGLIEGTLMKFSACCAQSTKDT